MICAVIKGPSFEEAHRQILKAIEYAQLVELRLDHFTSLDQGCLKTLCARCSIPTIFTLRSQIDGGNDRRPEEDRLTTIRSLMRLKPTYFDLESHVSPWFIAEISSQYPEVKLILSYHNLMQTPEDLEGIYLKMRKTPAFFYKVAVTAQNCLDAMRFICWAKQSDNQLIAISMGAHGQISRILGPMIGSPITYATTEEDQESLPFQLSAQTLVERYHYPLLKPNTGLYGLIGNPIDQSISDKTHNSLMRTCGLDAVYVKIQVSPPELADFLKFAKQFPFQGLSITMPLKECILPFLDQIDFQALKIGAVNTLLFEKDKISGFNTDGVGALNAIEAIHLVNKKHIVIIGAGGSSKAIAHEACQRGGFVAILNRDEEKALKTAQRIGCIGKGLDDMAGCAEIGYDILINCTPSPLPIASDYILSQAIVMDIKTKPKETTLLKLAMKKGCSIIYGYQMFIEQALGQFNLWFKGCFDIEKSRKKLKEKVLDCL